MTKACTPTLSNIRTVRSIDGCWLVYNGRIMKNCLLTFRLLFVHCVFTCLVVTGPFGIADEEIDFVRDIQPILKSKCYACHGPSKQKSGLRLDIKSEALKGGDAYGPSIIPKDSASPIIELITSSDPQSQMPPPEAGKLTIQQIETIQQWVASGADWPDGVDESSIEDRRDHWSFKPPKETSPPNVTQITWPRNEIDRFILARLESEGIAPASQADPITWLRRASFDLTGLPPTLEEIQAFVESDSSNAFEQAVERLLASQRYGERWAQHWLDVVRYADTHGFEVNTERPNAWPYRDYVIRAFNKDTPFDQFIREQIFGDMLGEEAATGFLITASVLLPGQIGKDAPSIRLARQDALDEIVVNLGQSFLGLSIGCARCHDHKFDPISAREYYAMQSFVAGVEYEDRDLNTPEAVQRRREVANMKVRVHQIEEALTNFEPFASANGQATRPTLNAKRNVDRFQSVRTQRLRFQIEKTNQLEPCIDELEVFDSNNRNIALASLGTKVTSSGDNVAPGRHELKFLNDGQYGNSRSWMSSEVGKGWVELEFPQESVISRVVWGRDREGQYQDRLAIEYRIEIPTASPSLETRRVSEDSKSADRSPRERDREPRWQTIASSKDRKSYTVEQPVGHTFSTEGLTPEEAQRANQLLEEKKRIDTLLASAANEYKAFAGLFRKPDEIRLLNRGDPEQPKELVTPAVLDVLGNIKLPVEATDAERRKALAEWIASPDNPLTARVMVNRIWQGHFGIGLVDTASDFGRTGSKPSHPELLDWLAIRFLKSGWSIKEMHRLIVLSASYRQSSQHNLAAATVDVDDRLLWRYPPRRLEAESIRDSMLFVSGRLNLEMYGRGFDLFDKRGGLTGFNPIESFGDEGHRRMVYAHKVRREREAVFGAFDCPDAGQSTARRRESTTPIQALNLFNSRFTVDHTQAFAERVKSEVGADVDKQVERVFQIAYSRPPKSVEASECIEVVQQYGLSTLCRVVFNSNEFLYIP
jgi:Protein of unknown function (DUF1553)/Protein of unknown function (DUF1549)/Planctomycete cytochrome C